MMIRTLFNRFALLFAAVAVTGPAFAQEAIAAGVCSYNLSGVALQDVRPIMASAPRHRLPASR